MNQLPAQSSAVGSPRGRDATDWTGLAARLKRYALALTRDVHQADDLAQQTLAAMLLKGDGARDPEAYAITAATRLWISQQRSLRRSVQRLARIAAERAGVLDTSPRSASETDEDRAALDRAIQSLPPVQRAVFVLRVVEELDYAGIAAAMECDVGAVRSNLHLARSRLRQTLADLNPATRPEQNDQPERSGAR